MIFGIRCQCGELVRGTIRHISLQWFDLLVAWTKDSRRRETRFNDGACVRHELLDDR
jgi:hypothetical protein